MQASQELKFNEWYEKDRIKNLSDFCEGFSSKLVSNWINMYGRDSLTFCKQIIKMKKNCIQSDGRPLFSWHENMTIKQIKIQWILELGNNVICDLNLTLY